MKIFITGATGFIGTHLINRLVQSEHEAICLVRPTSNVKKLEKLGVTLVLGDVTDPHSVLEGMKGCDWVMNLANIHSFWERDRSLYWKVNVTGTGNVMESALRTKIKKVIHVSTVAIWGKPLTWPITEDKDVGPERFSDYARTKYEGDLVAWELFRNKGLPLVVIYPAGVIGPGNTKYSGQYTQNLVHERLPLLAFKESISTFVHVKDVADAIVRAAEKKDNIGEKYIVGTHQLSIREYSELISEVSGAKLPRYTMPDWFAGTNAFLLTMFGRVTGISPLWGLSIDAAKTLEQDLAADGSKAQRELGITYTPVRKAIEDEIHPPREAEHLYKHRRYSRFKVSRPLTLQPENMEQRIVQLRDISRGGLFVETDKPLKKGMEVAANFSEKPEERLFTVKGKVLRKTNKGMAVQFTGGGADNISTLLMH
jgi:dihydroflavonol-4-reductase